MKTICLFIRITLFVGCTSSDNTVKPNLLVIMADSLSYIDIGMYRQDSVSVTPHIDRLAQKGVCFTNGYSISSSSASSLYALMTGKSPWKVEIAGKETVTLPGMLRKVGYLTVAAGYWYLMITPKGASLKSKENAKGMGFDYSSEEGNGDVPEYSIYKAIDFITQHNYSSFFLYYGLSVGAASYLHGDIDRHIDILLSKLEDKKMLDNTWIVFSSYCSAVNEENHVPFFVYWKGKISPVVSEALVSPIDLIASLGKLVGVSIPEGLDSREYVNAIMGKSLETREELLKEVQGELKKSMDKKGRV